MRTFVAALFAAALLILAACSEKTEELSTTDPTGTLPFPSDAGPRDPSPPDLPPPTTTTAVAAPETSGDDSGFDADTTRTGRDVPAPGTAAPTATDGTGSRP
jgi:hypothetical protein